MLISILLPALTKARRSAQTVVCASNLRQIGLATLMYEQEFKSFPARDNTGNGQIRPTWPLEMLLPAYLPSAKVVVCPANPDHTPMRVYWWNNTPVPTTPVDWTLTADTSHQSYGYNFRALGNSLGDRRTKLVNFKRASETIMYGDSQEQSEIYPFNPAASNWSGQYVISCVPYGERIGTRHDGGANALFLDGHVVWGVRDTYAGWTLIKQGSLPQRLFFPFLTNDPLHVTPANY